MIFLILKIFVYLLLALAAGIGAGWLLRHMAATKQEEDMQRTLADARARVPQFESLIRSRDEQIKRLKEELRDKDVRINGLVDDVREAELSLKDRDRELKAVTARQETLIDTAEAPVDPGATEDLKAELEARLEQKTEEYERLARSLEDEQRRIAELERERALQNQSLRVLHQQLELAEERNQRAAAG